jgi:hypothetical protein
MWITVTAFSAATLIALALFQSRPRRMASDEFVAILESWLAGTLTAGEWDYFECSPLGDPRLESLRQRCTAISLDPSLTLDPQRSWELNEAGKAEVRSMILVVRGHAWT